MKSTRKFLICALALILVPALAFAADPAKYANPAEKVVGTVFTQAVGVVADIPGVVIRGGDRVNVDYMIWLAGINAGNNQAYLNDLVNVYKEYVGTAMAINGQYVKSKKTAIDRRLRDAQMKANSAYLVWAIETCQIRNKFVPKVKFDSPKVMAEMLWGATKGALNYDMQVVDRVLGTAANTATLAFNNTNYAPGIWESGPIHRYMWENDAANVAKLAAVIACPIAGGVYGVAIFGQAAYTPVAIMSLTATCAHGAQAFFTALDEANKKFQFVK